ncbi:MAG TPA: DUF1579 family protein [Trueperaceae bacterium]
MSLEPLIDLVGRWQGQSTLQDPLQGVADESESKLVVSPLLGGRFVSLDYDWSYQDQPQEGSLLLGYEPASQPVTAHWIDSWHMGRGVMACRGSARGGKYAVTGSYSVPGGEPWGWRIELEAGPGLHLIMYNITPQGEEGLAVEASYFKVSLGSLISVCLSGSSTRCSPSFSSAGGRVK